MSPDRKAYLLAYRIANKEKIKEYTESRKEIERINGIKRRLENKEKIAAEKKIYYDKNKVKILEKRRKYNQDNAEKISVRVKKYYENNKSEINAQKKEYTRCFSRT